MAHERDRRGLRLLGRWWPRLGGTSHRGAAAALALLLGGVACGGGAGDVNDAGGHDYVIPDVTFGDLPEACAHGQGNEKGVGAPCSMGGGECKRYGNLICACEPLLGYMLAGAPCICTIPIFGQTCTQIPGDYCGSNATCCSYADVGSACFPNACLDLSMCPMEPIDAPDGGDPSDAAAVPD